MKLAVIFLGLLAIAGEHREHSAHVHGLAAVNIAFDGLVGQLDLHAPAADIFGFERKALGKNDLQAQEAKLRQLDKEVPSMVSFETRLGCKFKKLKMEVEQQGSHSDLDAQFEISCSQDPLNSTLKFDFQKYFPSLKKVNVSVLLGNLQKSITVEKSGTSIELK